jgi:sterol desaturase/sphingolipid hydroxylase (fatty acid hydroxylase superfamily)
MRNQIATRGLPVLLVMMGIAVILILAGAGSAGLIFGLVVAGTAGVLIMAMVLHDVASTEAHRFSHEDRVYRRRSLTS